jgi:DNA mismatch repair ATPase MutS
LGKTIQLFDQRLNMLLGAIFNGLFLWDLVMCIRLKKWYNQHSNKFEQWINTLSEVEALNSFACFKYNHPDYVFPQPTSGSILQAEALGHPLIPETERVNNAFSINGSKRICVVTGANMAGKSTFLRTIGVNLVLAGNGCVVAAGKLSYKPLTFVTNMRAVDNLLKHESYFFAELSRLQMIMERLKEKGELFFILDEILKGTNSHDKTNGSLALIKQLLKFNGTGIIATHDLELEQLSIDHPKEIFNNCFEVTFEGDKLSFDYKLRDGVTQSHNASFLMRKMGLIPTN